MARVKRDDSTPVTRLRTTHESQGITDRVKEFEAD